MLVSQIDCDVCMQYSAYFHIGGLPMQKSEFDMGDVIGKEKFWHCKQGKV